MSYHEGSNWQAKKEDAGKPLYENNQIGKGKRNNNQAPVLIKVKVVEDDGEYYVIPAILEDIFKRALKDANISEAANDNFIKLFSEYLVGADLSSIELYAESKRNAGATEWTEKAQGLLDALEYLNKGYADDWPADVKEMVFTALAKYKEVGNAKS